MIMINYDLEYFLNVFMRNLILCLKNMWHENTHARKLILTMHHARKLILTMHHARKLILTMHHARNSS